MESQDAPDAGCELADTDDADLLLYMRMADEGADSARAAWEVFYRRHVEYLYYVCMRAYGAMLGGEPGAADLVGEVFRTAYENAHKFDAAGIENPERLRWRARAWLGWIARRIVQDILRARKRVPTRSLELDHWSQVPQRDPQPRTTSANEQAVREAIGSLSEREQLVIRTTFQWYRPETRHQRLPSEVVAELARTLRTTPENLRQIRRRALKKIAEFVRTRTNEQRKEKTDEQEASEK